MLSVIVLHLYLVAHSPGVTYQPHGKKLAQDMIQASAMFDLPIEDILVISYKEAKFDRKSKYVNKNGTVDYGAMSLNSAYVLSFYKEFHREFNIHLTINEIYNDNIILGAYHFHRILETQKDKAEAFKVYNGGRKALQTGTADAYAEDAIYLLTRQAFWQEVYPRFLKTVFLVNGHVPTSKDLSDFPIMRYNLTN